MTSLEIRKMNCELGPLSKPDGSTLLSLGGRSYVEFFNQTVARGTMTLSAVYGPCEVKPQKLLTESATIEVIYRPKAGPSGITDKLKESTLLSIFKTAILTSQNPRSSILIIVQEMQDYGGLLACSINSACLALMNSGVPMKFLVAAVSCMIDHNNTIVLDPDLSQLKESKSTFTLVFDGIEKNVIASSTSGTFTREQLKEVFETCREGSTKIFQFYHDIIKKSTVEKSWT